MPLLWWLPARNNCPHVKSCPEPTYPLWEWAGPQNHLPSGLEREAGQRKAFLLAESSEIWSREQPEPFTCSVRHRLSTDGRLFRIPRPGFGQHMPQEDFMGQDATSHSEKRGKERVVSDGLITAGKLTHKPWHNALKQHFTEPRAHPGWFRLRKGLRQILPLWWVSVSPSAKWRTELHEQAPAIFWSLISLRNIWEWNPHISNLFINYTCTVVPIIINTIKHIPSSSTCKMRRLDDL